MSLLSTEEGLFEKSSRICPQGDFELAFLRMLLWYLKKGEVRMAYAGDAGEKSFYVCIRPPYDVGSRNL